MFLNLKILILWVSLEIYISKDRVLILTMLYRLNSVFTQWGIFSVCSRWKHLPVYLKNHLNWLDIQLLVRKTNYLRSSCENSSFPYFFVIFRWSTCISVLFNHHTCLGVENILVTFVFLDHKNHFCGFDSRQSGKMQ